MSRVSSVRVSTHQYTVACGVVVKGLAHAISRFFQPDLRGIPVENLLDGPIIDECKHTLSNAVD
jgi:hypothetical protein